MGGASMKKNCMDKVGRIYVPTKIRSKLGFLPGDGLYFSAEEESGRLIVGKRETACFSCGKKDHLLTLKDDFYLCEHCLDGLNEQKNNKKANYSAFCQQ